MTASKYQDGDYRKPNRTNKRSDLLPGQAEFIEWLTDPQRPGSHESYARDKGVDPSTLYRWKKDPLFIKGWERALADMNVNPERTQKLMDRVYAIATGDLVREADAIKATELYMRLVDKISPNRLVIEDGRTAADLDDDELIGELEGTLVALRGGKTG